MGMGLVTRVSLSAARESSITPALILVYERSYWHIVAHSTLNSLNRIFLVDVWHYTIDWGAVCGNGHLPLPAF